MEIETSVKPQINLNRTIFIVAGETSGDLHGSNLVKELKHLDRNLTFIGLGGDKMKAAGVKLIEHVSKLSLVGLTEVMKHIPFIRQVMKRSLRTIKEQRPVRIILIDYPGFNLRLIKKVARLNIPITYFILPQVWAWKENRVEILKKYADQALSIIPFEQSWYKERQMPVDYAGNPLVDMEIPDLSKKDFFIKHNLKTEYPLLVLLPGSRQQEVDRHWPILLETIIGLREIFPNLQFVIGRAPNIVLSDVPAYVKIETDNSYLAMRYGTAGIVASGTATLEAAIFNLPIVVCYKTSGLTHWVGKRFVKVNYLSLVNLIANNGVVPELVQKDMIPKKIMRSVVPLLSDTPEREKMLFRYKRVTSLLGKKGVYKRAAILIYSKL